MLSLKLSTGKTLRKIYESLNKNSVKTLMNKEHCGIAANGHGFAMG
jgi:hypothetical protein